MTDLTGLILVRVVPFAARDRDSVSDQAQLDEAHPHREEDRAKDKPQNRERNGLLADRLLSIREGNRRRLDACGSGNRDGEEEDTLDDGVDRCHLLVDHGLPTVVGSLTIRCCTIRGCTGGSITADGVLNRSCGGSGSVFGALINGRRKGFQGRFRDRFRESGCARGRCE